MLNRTKKIILLTALLNLSTVLGVETKSKESIQQSKDLQTQEKTHLDIFNNCLKELDPYKQKEIIEKILISEDEITKKKTWLQCKTYEEEINYGTIKPSSYKDDIKRFER